MKFVVVCTSIFHTCDCTYSQCGGCIGETEKVPRWGVASRVLTSINVTQLWYSLCLTHSDKVDVSTLVNPNLCLHHTVQCRGKHTKFSGRPGGNLVAGVSLYSGNRGTLTCKCRDWRLFRARKI